MARQLNDKSNVSKQITGCQSLIAGVNKHLAQMPTLTFAGTEYTPAEAASALQGRIDAILAVQAAKGAWLAAVNHMRDEKSNTSPIVSGLHLMAQAMFGTETDILSDFGMVPRKRTAPSAATVATAVLKNEATRLARGTKGPKAKLKIHGTLPVTVGPEPPK